MHQDNKVLLSAILILGLSLLSFNFVDVSGRVSSSLSGCKVYVEIHDITPGHSATITLRNPSNCRQVGNTVSFYNSGERKGVAVIPRADLDQLRYGSKTVTYKTSAPIDWGFNPEDQICIRAEDENSCSS